MGSGDSRPWFCQGSARRDAPKARSLTSKATLRNPGSLAMAAGEPGTEPGRTKLESSRRPLRLRYCWASELDLMARLAGMRLRECYQDWDSG